MDEQQLDPVLEGERVRLIPDDPIIRCIERTGYPPWIRDEWEEDDEEDDETEEADELPGTAPRL